MSDDGMLAPGDFVRITKWGVGFWYTFPLRTNISELPGMERVEKSDILMFLGIAEQIPQLLESVLGSIDYHNLNKEGRTEKCRTLRCPALLSKSGRMLLVPEFLEDYQSTIRDATFVRLRQS